MALADGGSYEFAVAGAALAAAHDEVLLLTPGSHLGREARATLTALRPTTVTLLGDPDRLGPLVHLSVRLLLRK